MSQLVPNNTLWHAATALIEWPVSAEDIFLPQPRNECVGRHESITSEYIIRRSRAGHINDCGSKLVSGELLIRVKIGSALRGKARIL